MVLNFCLLVAGVVVQVAPMPQNFKKSLMKWKFEKMKLVLPILSINACMHEQNFNGVPTAITLD